MKKLLSLMLAAALALSLVACGGGGGTWDTNTSSGIKTEEEMLEAATECDFAAIQSSYNENKVRAEEAYCGDVYRVTGYVERIEETSAKIIPLNAPVGIGEAYSMALEATLSTEDIRELSTWEVVNIVGEISSLGKGTVFMEHAYYVDNLITFTGTVDGFAYDMASGCRQTTIIEKPKITVTGGRKANLSYAYLGQSTSINTFEEQETIQGVTVLEGDTVTVTGKLTYYITDYTQLGSSLRVYTRKFNLTDIETIEKN